VTEVPKLSPTRVSSNHLPVNIDFGPEEPLSSPVCLTRSPRHLRMRPKRGLRRRSGPTRTEPAQGRCPAGRNLVGQRRVEVARDPDLALEDS
jgi:hypothetical protein